MKMETTENYDKALEMQEDKVKANLLMTSAILTYIFRMLIFCVTWRYIARIGAVSIITAQPWWRLCLIYIGVDCFLHFKFMVHGKAPAEKRSII